MTQESYHIIQRLVDKGVRIPCPNSIQVGPEVNPDRISGKGVVIHTGCKIYGSQTLIMDGCELGAEGPATITNCQLGRGVKLAAGSFKESCFLDGASMGPGAQVRECCLLEEGARGAHTVGLKHTILFPFVTLGSLINFCDCLMAGGTDEKNHSEVGSSYIHFNYTPDQDKATASLIGDVPRGVMLNQPPIFLGGQGGIVGPVRITYGVVVAAGTIVRKDILEQDTVLLGHPSIPKRLPRHFGLYANVRRIIELNSLYIANLIALRRWYLEVRPLFLSSSPMEKALCIGGLDKIERAIRERVKRLGEVASRMETSIGLYQKTGAAHQAAVERKREFQKNWPRVEEAFEECLHISGKAAHYQVFRSALEQGIKEKGVDYLSVIKGLGPAARSEGTRWLEGIVDKVMEKVWACLPGFRPGRRK